MKKILHQFALTLLIFVSLIHAVMAMQEAPIGAKKLSISSSKRSQRNSGPDRGGEMQDYSAMQDDCFFGVFDGHGGKAVAEFFAQNLWREISDAYKQNPDMTQAVETSINKLDQETAIRPEIATRPAAATRPGLPGCGSTAVFGILHDENLLTIANVGDSRAVVCRNGEVDFVTREHLASDPEEQERIVEAGCEKIMIGADATLPEGIQSWTNTEAVKLVKSRHNYDFLFLHKIHLSLIAGQPPHYSWRLGPLSASRDLGYYMLNQQEEQRRKPKGLIATPDITTLKLDPSYEFVIFATDGLWDVMTNEEVVEFVHKRLTSKSFGKSFIETLDMISAELVDRARMKARQVTNSFDDITVVIVRFEWLDKPNLELQPLYTLCPHQDFSWAGEERYI